MKEIKVYCHNCGNRVDVDGMYCDQCGCSLEREHIKINAYLSAADYYESKLAGSNEKELNEKYDRASQALVMYYGSENMADHIEQDARREDLEMRIIKLAEQVCDMPMVAMPPKSTVPVASPRGNTALDISKPKTWSEVKSFSNLEYANQFLRSNNNIVGVELMANTHSSFGLIANHTLIDSIAMMVTYSEHYFPIVYQIGNYEYTRLVISAMGDLKSKIQSLNQWAHIVSVKQWHNRRTRYGTASLLTGIRASSHTTVCCLYTQDINDYRKLRYTAFSND